MVNEAQNTSLEKGDAFADSHRRMDALVERLSADEVTAMRHEEVEGLLHKEGMELLRQLLQDHLDLRSLRESDEPVVGSDGKERPYTRLTERHLETVFGTVTVSRLEKSARGVPSLHPLDAELNLPNHLYSHGVCKQVSEQAAMHSYEQVVEEVAKTSGAHIGKHQCEQVAVQAAVDFEPFYAQSAGSQAASGEPSAEAADELVVLSTDGKGIVVRPQDLREATAKKASQSKHKLDKRLCRGEKRNRKRMATVAAVYTTQPFVRTAEEVVGELHGSSAPVPGEPKRRPRPRNKRVWASVKQSAPSVIEQTFEEAQRRDPHRSKTWVAVVDGNKDQLRHLQAFAKQFGVVLLIVLDLIHVLDYLWKAAYVFCAEGSAQAQAWVSERLLWLLQGRSSQVAAALRRSATRRGLTPQERAAADACANYLTKNKKFLRYNEYLEQGVPIASGVIEGACRHLVKDRMDVTGARWSLDGAEAVVQLRALKSSGDFEAYWRFHVQQEFERNHARCYANGVPNGRQQASSPDQQPVQLQMAA